MSSKDMGPIAVTTVWLTADWHLSHFNIIKHCKRPFKTEKDMDTRIMMNFLSKVREGDTVYFLGDLAWKDAIAELAFQNMPKKIDIHFILGNHDKKCKKTVIKYCKTVKQDEMVVIEDQQIMLSHYPLQGWGKSHPKTWNLHGHCHGTFQGNKLQYDVGVDCNNFYPVSFEELKEIMRSKN
jgi:calcineurin-like phosphoesterase family protein